MKIEEIKGYLGTGVDFRFKLSDVVNVTKDEVRTKKLTDESLTFALKYGKLILHPLSDLTKEIEVNEEKFVPIIELFQLIDGGSYTEDNVIIKNEKGWFVISNSISQLSFNSKENYFNYKTFDFEGEDWQPSFNQLELFNKLYEWHFNIHGIEAIDINTL